ncbi:Nramp family divalent metal transporter [Streptomyces sp. NPDC051132]|uniref:Nramp family divalent metal transporter n=1 Tax=unclassified Streptomyces TaxID=2593676 RepID=UPI00342568EF
MMLDPRSCRRVPAAALRPPTTAPTTAPGHPADGHPAADHQTTGHPAAGHQTTGEEHPLAGAGPPPAVPETVAAGPRAGRGPLRGRHGLAVLGPALVVSVAYLDPGNFATNMTAGSRYGPLLLWVIVLSNAVATGVQYLACKVGIATGRDLPELCREHTPRPVTYALWGQAELVAMATDLTEFVGGAVALHLLFGLPLLPAALLVAALSLALLVLAPEGRRRFETVTALLLLVLVAGFAYQFVRAGSWHGTLSGLRPALAGNESLTLATGIVGATVMPHVIYLHSSLGKMPATTPPEEKRRVLRGQRISLPLTLGLAGLVNAGMLALAATALRSPGQGGESLDDFHDGLRLALGPGAALAFALALLASGLASAGVGTFAGQVIMRGFLHRRIPLLTRRLLTMTPPLAVLATGIPPTQALLLSQIVLSCGIPCALGPLLWFTARRSLMGSMANHAATTALATLACAAISVLNVLLVARAVHG